MELDLTMKKLLLAAAIWLLPTIGWAQCTGVFRPNTLCGNLSGVPAPPSQFSATLSVFGPSSSTSGQVPTFGNSTGNQFVDPAIIITSQTFNFTLGMSANTVGTSTLLTTTDSATTVITSSLFLTNTAQSSPQCAHLVGGYVKGTGSDCSSSSGLTIGERVTFIPGQPLANASVTAATSLFVAPIPGVPPVIPIWNTTGATSVFTPTPFTVSNSDFTGLKLVLDHTTTDTNYHASGSAFDVFVGWTGGSYGSGTLVAGTGPAYSSVSGVTINGPCGASASGGHGQGAGTTQLIYWGGLCVNQNPVLIRYNTGVTSGTFTCPIYQCTGVAGFYVPSATTTLSTAILTTSQTSAATVDSWGIGPQGFPYSPNIGVNPFYMKVDNEIMLASDNQCTVTGNAGCQTYAGTWTITRGQLGTTAATHTVNTSVFLAPGQTQCQTQSAPGTGGAQGGDNPMCLISNFYNQQPIVLSSRDYTLTWTYSNANTWRACDGSNANRITWFDPLGTTLVSLYNRASLRGFGDSAVGTNSVSAPTGGLQKNTMTTNSQFTSPYLTGDGVLSGGPAASGNQTVSTGAADDTEVLFGVNYSNCLEYNDQTTVAAHSIFQNGQGYQKFRADFVN